MDVGLHFIQAQGGRLCPHEYIAIPRGHIVPTLLGRVQMSNRNLKNAALWITGRTLTLIVFIAVSLGSCATANVAASAIFYPAQTVFPGGTPPQNFLVVVEDLNAAGVVEGHRVLAWQYAQEILAKEPQRARLTVREGRRFRILEEGPGYQVVEARHTETAYITTRYRVEGGKVIPLYYKVNAALGSLLNILMLPVAVFGLWLGRLSARRFLEFFTAKTSAQPTSWHA